MLPRVNWTTGELEGEGVRIFEKTLAELDGIFAAPVPAEQRDRIAYRVQCWFPVPEGTTGGLFWGSTTIEAGDVDGEYYMTHGHLHRVRERAEYYVTVRGKGALLLMDEQRRTWLEAMAPGSLHYIAGGLAHRVVNTGSVPLTFVACWPSDAGHDYGEIRRLGFSARLRRIGGEPVLIPEGDNARAGD